MTDETRTDAPRAHVATPERERQDADRQYNEALTRLDRALPHQPALPSDPQPYDQTKLGAINDAWNVLPDGPPAIDRSLKGRLRGLIWRLVGPPLERQRQFNAAIVDHLNRNAAVHADARQTLSDTLTALRDQASRTAEFQSALIQYLQTLTLYIDTKDRAIGSLPAIEDVRIMATVAQRSALALKRDVEKLLATEDGRPDGRPLQPSSRVEAPAEVALKYVGFQDAFRGSAEEVRRKLETYVPLFQGRSEVLDIGCGRGEFLDLLRQSGVTASGVDANPAMVDECRARGLDAHHADALAYLAACPDGSIGGIFSSQVVEHLAPNYLLKLIETAYQKLRPGGVLVLETINPACWSAFFNAYIRDVTHVRPLHPDTLQFFLRVNGFADVDIDYRSPVPDSDRLQQLPKSPNVAADLATLVATFNANAGKLNARMFTYQDYAVIGRR